MASLELNIYDRGETSTQWSPDKGKLTKGELDKVGENKTDNGNALNAVPSPFARFHVVKEAFRRVHEELIHENVKAGDAYRKLVSDCLDVYELLYYWNYHKSHRTQNIDIHIREWKKSANIQQLQNMAPIFGNSVDYYLGRDINTDTLYFIILEDNGKEYLLATSSPMTGFVTPPDLDRKPYSKMKEFMGSRYKDMPTIKRRGKGIYFDDVSMFNERPREFKMYMYNMFRNSVVNETFKNIRDYIGEFNSDPDIRNIYNPIMSPVLTEDNNALVINGLAISESKGIDTLKFFGDYIIKLPYRISAENFVTPEYVNDLPERDYDYLIPLTQEALEVLPVHDLKIKIKENRKKGDFAKVEVSFNYNGEEQKHVYGINDRPASEQGCIVDLKKDWKVSLDLGLFPNVLSYENAENNYFKVMIAVYDENEFDQIGADNTTIEFYNKKGDENGYYMIEEMVGSGDYKEGVRAKGIRSKQSKTEGCTTLFYEVFNTSFDIMRLTLNGESGGILIPNWTESQNSNKSYTYAIDFGTSNTYVSRRENNQNSEPQQLTMKQPIMSYLHEKLDHRQLAPIDCWECKADQRLIEMFQMEFVPAFIDGNRYKFPLRTALCCLDNNADTPMLFDNRNISFCYEKKKIKPGNRMITDLKWADDNTNQSDAKVYIRELLTIIKSDILNDNGDLSQTKIIWFQPLSFKARMRMAYEKIWSSLCQEILGIPSSQVVSYTESEAPYYYFLQKNEFESTRAVSIIDIGGGSTDLVYFHDDQPVIANSIHFGCDVLWGNGNTTFANAKNNGIFQSFKDIVQFNSEELKAINDDMCKEGSLCTTTDIINFWIGNDKETNITTKLSSEYKPLFLYHYAAIIYHMASVYHAKNLECPTTITFSGNGSRYIDDLLVGKNIDLLVNLTMIILKDVFGNDTPKVQIILPDQRKECTCYGGLYRNADRETPQAFHYIGYGDKEYETAEELEKDYFQGLRNSISQEVSRLNSLYIKMLSMLIKEEQLDEKTETIKGLLNVKISEELDKIYKRDIKGKEGYNDSLFFIPVIEQLFNLTKKV